MTIVQKVIKKVQN